MEKVSTATTQDVTEGSNSLAERKTITERNPGDSPAPLQLRGGSQHPSALGTGTAIAFNLSFQFRKPFVCKSHAAL